VSVGGSCQPARDFPAFLRWDAKGQLDLDAMVTARYQLTEINSAVAALGRRSHPGPRHHRVPH
jgi:S-(hydroxymethyl)glutathione dehydrogenase/alcohol dehydrogenase